MSAAVHFIAGVSALRFAVALKFPEDALAVFAFEVLVVRTSAIELVGLVAAVVHVVAAQIGSDAPLVQALEVEVGTLTESYTIKQP